MNSVAILLSDHESINELILLKSLSKIKKSKLKFIYLIGDKNKFPTIFNKASSVKKMIFLHSNLNLYQPHKYINEITKIGINLFSNKKIKFLINMPLNKKKFLKNFIGYTEFFSNKLNNKKKFNMLLYNENFSVCPITTHIQIKDVEKNITKYKILQSIKNIIFFYKKILKKKTNIIVLGLNPHASKDMKNSFDHKVLLNVVNIFKKKGISIEGPVSPDTAFSNVKNKIFIGMYHDQVLIPFKLINKFNGINITIGNKYIRMSPDHGTGEKWRKKSSCYISNESFLKCIEFCENH